MSEPTTSNRLTVFLDTLRRTRLLDGPQLDAVLARPDARGDDPKPLAKFLLQAGLLTRYQLTHLANGHDAALVLGPFRLLDKAGDTDLGPTYKAVHSPSGRVVAVKGLAPGVQANAESIRRFQAEVNPAAPPPVLDAGHAGGRHYLALDAAPPAAATQATRSPTLSEARPDVMKFEAADDEDASGHDLAAMASPSTAPRRRKQASAGKTMFGIAAGASMHIAAVVLLVLFAGGYFTWRATKPPAKKDPNAPTVSAPVAALKPAEVGVARPPEGGTPAVPPEAPANLLPLDFTAAAAALKPEPAPAPTKVAPQLKKFDEGHTGPALVAALPDGKSVLTAGRDGQLILWDAETGKKLRAVPTPHKVSAFAVNPAGTFAATGGDDRAVRVWDLADLREVAALDGHTGKPAALAFAPNGKYLLSGGDDGAAKLWDLTHRKAARDLRPAAPVTAVAVSPDGRKAALGTDRGPIYQYDLESAQQNDVFNGHIQSVNGLDYSADGTVLASVGEDRNVRFWDTANPRKPPVKVLLRQPLKSVAFAGDGSWALVCGESSVFAAAHDGSNGALPLGESAPLASLAPAADGGSVFLGNDRGAVRQLLFTGGANERTLFASAPPPAARVGKGVAKGKGKSRPAVVPNVPEPNPDPPETTANATLKWDSNPGAQHHVEFSRDGRWLMTVGADKSVRLYEVAGGKEKYAVPAVANVKAGACLLPDATGFIASGNPATVIRGVSVPTDCLVRRHTFEGRTQPTVVCAMVEYLSYDIGALSLTQNGQFLVTGGPDSTVRVWSARGGTTQPAKQWIGHSGRIQAVASHPKTETFASLANDGSVRFWQGSRAIKQLAVPTSSTMTTLEFSPDGKYVLVAGSDYVAVWDWNAATVYKQFKSPAGFAPAHACWAAGGAVVVATAAGSGAVAYDLETQRELARVAGPGGLAHGVAASPDGKLIAVSGRGVGVYELDKPLAAVKPGS